MSDENSSQVTTITPKKIVLSVVGVVIAILVIFSYVDTTQYTLPDCGDKEATDLVKQIYRQEFGEVWAATIAQHPIVVEFITLESKDEETGRKYCNADLVNGELRYNVSYNIAASEDPNMPDGYFILRAEFRP